jgi:O-acetyl-ADP-ribose deacetylase (regulator of RNase III)
MITFSNRRHANHGDLIAAHVGPELIALFNPALQIVNASQTEITVGGNLTASLDDRRFDYIVRECLNIIRLRTNDNRPMIKPPARGQAAASQTGRLT